MPKISNQSSNYSFKLSLFCKRAIDAAIRTPARGRNLFMRPSITPGKPTRKTMYKIISRIVIPIAIFFDGLLPILSATSTQVQARQTRTNLKNPAIIILKSHSTKHEDKHTGKTLSKVDYSSVNISVSNKSKNADSKGNNKNYH